MYGKPVLPSSLVLLTGLAAVALAGCSGGEAPAPTAAVEPAAEVAGNAQAEADKAAELAAKEEALARREAELELKEREQALAAREAELAAKESAAKKATPRPAAPAPVKAPPRTPVVAATTPSASAPAKAAVPATIVVPAGTTLSVALSSALSTKSATVGQPFEARLASDVMVEGRRALTAGSRITGTVTDVVSGSNKIGGIPTLGLRFESLDMEDGSKVPLSGRLVQQAKSDTAQDTAKIAGGTVAGAVIGHQIEDGNKGKIIGGLIGGAVGALIAQKTGSDVELPADSILSIAIDQPIDVKGR